MVWWGVVWCNVVAQGVREPHCRVYAIKRNDLLSFSDGCEPDLHLIIRRQCSIKRVAMIDHRRRLVDEGWGSSVSGDKPGLEPFKVRHTRPYYY